MLSEHLALLFRHVFYKLDRIIEQNERMEIHMAKIDLVTLNGKIDALVAAGGAGNPALEALIAEVDAARKDLNPPPALPTTAP